MMTDQTGKPVERYSYSPYGERTIYVDSTPPKVEQVRTVGGAIWMEISEAVSSEALQSAVASGALRLTDTATSTDLELAVDQPVHEGRQAGRRVVLTPTTPLDAGSALELDIEPAALVDAFQNRPTQAFTLPITWPATDEVLSDDTPPRVEQVVVRGGVVEIEFSEEPDLSAVGTVVTISGQNLTWELSDDGYAVQTTEPLPPGTYSAAISTAPSDLAGLGLSQDFGTSLTVNATDQLVYATSDPRLTSGSATGNGPGFQGHLVDPETGFSYLRNRYYWSMLRRFITADPLGYANGPSPYQFAGNEPFAAIDPFGLYIVGGSAELNVIRLTLQRAGASDMARKLTLSSYPAASFIKRLFGGIETHIELSGPDIDRENEIARLFRSAILSDVRIEFRLSTEENEGHGGVTTGRGLFGLPIFDPDRPDHENTIRIEINPEQVSRLRVLGPLSDEVVNSGKGYRVRKNTRISVPLEAAVVHEFAHAYWMYGLRNRAPYLNNADTNNYAVQWENVYRDLVGLPHRLWHD
jgi:RHS repeat-associated protein